MANTPKGYPYPLGTDRVADGDNVINGLASAVDSKLGVAACGTVQIQSVVPNNPVGVAVSFPVGRFYTGAPHGAITVTATRQGSDLAAVSTSCSAASPTYNGCTIFVWQAAGSATPQTATISWQAMQQ